MMKPRNSSRSIVSNPVIGYRYYSPGFTKVKLVAPCGFLGQVACRIRWKSLLRRRGQRAATTPSNSVGDALRPIPWEPSPGNGFYEVLPHTIKAKLGVGAAYGGSNPLRNRCIKRGADVLPRRSEATSALIPFRKRSPPFFLSPLKPCCSGRLLWPRPRRPSSQPLPLSPRHLYV